MGQFKSFLQTFVVLMALSQSSYGIRSCGGENEDSGPGFHGKQKEEWPWGSVLLPADTLSRFAYDMKSDPQATLLAMSKMESGTQGQALLMLSCLGRNRNALVLWGKMILEHETALKERAEGIVRDFHTGLAVLLTGPRVDFASKKWIVDTFFSPWGELDGVRNDWGWRFRIAAAKALLVDERERMLAEWESEGIRLNQHNDGDFAAGTSFEGKLP